MEQLLRMLMLLSGARRYSLNELQERFGVSERTIHRYLDAIEDAGFVLNRVHQTYNLQSDSAHVRSLQKLLHFSEEEAFIFYKAISLIEGTSPVKERLICKLNSLYDLKALSNVQDENQLEIIRKLSDAIKQKNQVVLNAYRSSNSDSIHDRIVEPFEFLPDYKAVWCYDKDGGCCKQFKLTRIQNVELMLAGWQNENLHQVPFVDAFHMAAEGPIANVKAYLSLKAYNLLAEEFPLAEASVQRSNGKYLLDIPVADFNGIGRFVMGLLDDVEVLQPKAFGNFLMEKIKKFGVLTEVDS